MHVALARSSLAATVYAYIYIFTFLNRFVFSLLQCCRVRVGSRSRGIRRFLREVGVRVGVEKRILLESGVRVEWKQIPGVRVGDGVKLKKWLRVGVRVELILLRLCNTDFNTLILSLDQLFPLSVMLHSVFFQLCSLDNSKMSIA